MSGEISYGSPWGAKCLCIAKKKDVDLGRRRRVLGFCLKHQQQEAPLLRANEKSCNEKALRLNPMMLTKPRKDPCIRIAVLQDALQ